MSLRSRVAASVPLDQLFRSPGDRWAALGERFALVARVLDVAHSGGRPDHDDVVAMHDRFRAPDPDEVWLALAVLQAELPELEDVVRQVRRIRLDGPEVVLQDLVLRAGLRRLRRRLPEPRVEVVTDEVLVDLEHTSRTSLATGIQRVARETARRWARDHDVVLVGWEGQRALRRLDRGESARALHGTEAPSGERGTADLVVPWGATYLLPELAPERDRTSRLAALARHARTRTGVIGFDCVPISSAETTDAGVSESFANNLVAVRDFTTVAAISEAAAIEYRGWRHMLSAIGRSGPTIDPVVLPVEPVDASEEGLVWARDELRTGTLPVVLCVGTHEPRKNHLAVLHACELLWRDGVRFSLAFIGGHAWNSRAFDQTLSSLRAQGRPVQNFSSVTDDQLWAAYRASRCVVFPSLNEGFGLPIAEALACGTPIVTSDFGSMAQIASAGGAELVDPRDDASIRDGLRRVLVDEDHYQELRKAAAARPRRTWDEYARDTWQHLAQSEKTP
ncbi:Glycosyl transferases group 1 [Klenkia marina]|uniref:Glycosyl transferases group 1 n=1 Tax=Klenkia marina TaxID=1960309 RepID=A0A1G4YDY4_9ACTN|nr:glycosyltransferase [Klenkia marina]SCX51757.1 Glycosyl transferases group 1 [Klenkia marina]